MTTGAETATAETWIYSTLANDATLISLGVTGVYSYIAPEGSAFPYILFQQQAASDVNAVGPTRIMAQLVYVIRVVTMGSIGSVVAISTRLDNVLQAQSGSNANGLVISCMRERPFVQVETVEGRSYRHLGGIYRLYVQ